MQLHQLRDCWRQGWKPKRLSTTYVIVHYSDGERKVLKMEATDYFLSFQDEERAQKFLDCFRDLTEGAGDLI